MEIKVVELWFGVIGAFLTIFGMWYRIDRDTNKKIDEISKTFSEQLADAMKQGDEKRARIYERLDTVKNEHKADFENFRKEIMENFVPAKICTLMHTSSERTMAGLKESVEKSIKELKDVIQGLESKVDKMNTKLYQKDVG